MLCKAGLGGTGFNMCLPDEMTLFIMDPGLLHCCIVKLVETILAVIIFQTFQFVSYYRQKYDLKNCDISEACSEAFSVISSIPVYTSLRNLFPKTPVPENLFFAL